MERADWVPQMDVFQRGDKLVVDADLPGLRQEDVHVSADYGILTISGSAATSMSTSPGACTSVSAATGTSSGRLRFPTASIPTPSRPTSTTASSR